MKKVVVLLLLTMLMTPALCLAESEFDPGTDELLEKAVEHAKEIHEDQNETKNQGRELIEESGSNLMK